VDEILSIAIFDVMASMPAERMPSQCLGHANKELVVLRCIGSAYDIGYVKTRLARVNKDILPCHRNIVKTVIYVANDWHHVRKTKT
jgi:hypothetical protein